MQTFQDRKDAGRQLATSLERYRGQNPVVLALPRGGVPVAVEVARELQAPLDVLVVRKIGAPLQPELGMGAIAEGGAVFLDQNVVIAVGATPDEVDRITERERAEVQRGVSRFRGDRPLPNVEDHTVILVDDGIATGGTVRAALRALRALGAGRIVVAAPVASAQTADVLKAEADDVVFVEAPESLWAIGFWYADFGQVSDEDVVRMLEEARRNPQQQEAVMAADPTQSEAGAPVSIPAGAVTLSGDLRIPNDARGVVLFAHGSGSSRFSPRNRFVARELAQSGLATLLVDLLTEGEEAQDDIDLHLRFNIGLLASRLGAATDWLLRRQLTSHLPIGYFGASTGAAAALMAAAERPGVIRALVSRGGRPDLAGGALDRVSAPTLLIVGGNDFGVIELNRSAFERLPAEKELVLVPGATHLFEEPGALDAVAQRAADWFLRHLAPKEETASP